jgi:hypothetical protein
MEKRKPPSERIIDKYLERLNEVYVNEVVVLFKNTDLKEFGVGKTKADTLHILIESGIWKKYDNKHDIRFDNRPQSQGGPQLHLKNRQGNEWAYRDNGSRSERNKYTTPSTRNVRDIVRNYFKLDPNIQIESQFVGFSNDKKQLLLEIYLS